MAAGFLSTVTLLAELCAKHVKRAAKKLGASSETSSSKVSPVRKTLATSKQLLTTLSNKAMSPFHHKKKNNEVLQEKEEEGFEGYGDGGLWQREIMMGEKCQPFDFSGVILYDTDGKRVSQLPPRSPRTPLSPRARPLQSSFSFPVLASATDMAEK